MNLGFLTIEQHDQMVDLLAQLHAHYHPGSRLPRGTFNAHLQRLCSGDSQLQLVTASQDNRLLGFAAVYLVASLVEPEPAKRLQCALKELFVAPEERSRGVGRALMKWVARYALDQGCWRIDWTVKSSNARGIDFYERLGAQWVSDRLSFRLERSGVSSVAAP
ncbi:GNAT family N-acetyltransferase [Variovorax sp. J22P168]|uniref:GNAT family N-acetyltransferase n=1 Tax=Variovorax jilinensis TaxID=3053513 RepID=UPI0025789C94|nr:GNAT family N-acetyltransferase [Variovorax sp. J22P168]MDM0015426.1 GNAT family N-acetyltransferase [Variovorax sp. J22P168]